MSGLGSAGGSAPGWFEVRRGDRPESGAESGAGVVRSVASKWAFVAWIWANIEVVFVAYWCCIVIVWEVDL